MSPSRLVVVLLAIFSVPVSAQIPPTSDTTSTPIPGAGHDYLGGAIDTVNPANGALSIRIPVIIPRGRGLTLPFNFAYDSNGAAYVGQASNGGIYWLAANSLTSSGGWSNTVPILSVGETGYTVPGSIPINNPAPQTCGALINYVFQDPNGNRHDLNLSVFGRSGTNNGGDCSQSSYAWVATGGEGSILATTASELPGAGFNNVVIQPVTVTDGDGTVYNFPASGIVTTGLFPILIADRNGNKISVTRGTQGYTLTDTLGRTVINDSGFGTSPETLSVAGLTRSYTLYWSTLPAATFTTTFTNFGTSPCPAPVHSGGEVLSALGLPNGQSLSFGYDQAYGMVNRITYPTGAYVRYVWGMNPQSEAGAWSFNNPTTLPPKILRLRSRH